ncbi:hypothetical protein CDAR_514321 [Caerostris darwini]|uniref:Uncharacterized protein n=1 Tax=Caerostris darwini TaxID=1538125 RepID=A0AAV4UNP8_9ARAC|nr:hypothetical protein CDAR_514321 [Caerostris darwini]
MHLADRFAEVPLLRFPMLGPNTHKKTPESAAFTFARTPRRFCSEKPFISPASGQRVDSEPITSRRRETKRLRHVTARHGGSLRRAATSA